MGLFSKSSNNSNAPTKSEISEPVDVQHIGTAPNTQHTSGGGFGGASGVGANLPQTHGGGSTIVHPPPELDTIPPYPTNQRGAELGGHHTGQHHHSGVGVQTGGAMGAVGMPGGLDDQKYDPNVQGGVQPNSHAHGQKHGLAAASAAGVGAAGAGAAAHHHHHKDHQHHSSADPYSNSTTHHTHGTSSGPGGYGAAGEQQHLANTGSHAHAKEAAAGVGAAGGAAALLHEVKAGEQKLREEMQEHHQKKAHARQLAEQEQAQAAQRVEQAKKDLNDAKLLQKEAKRL
ncbi:hypothetical protein T439DRAFT_345889 [Meredithblackwellia eburnea MCA 4105]